MRDTTPPPPSNRGPRSAAQRGFTLVELLVALGAGVLVAAAAFLMSKNATRFFQHEARISAAQLAVTLGMNRITADLQRAGFLSSPNLPADPARCQGTNWPAGLNLLAGIQITQGSTLPALPQSAANGVSPDSLTIGGAFDTTEQFPIRSITDGTVRLQMDVGPMVRAINASAQAGGTLQSTMSRIFRPGRFLRVVDTEGRHEYGVITAVTANGTPPQVQIQLDAGVTLPQKSEATTCGISQGFNTGLLANPIARIRYDLRSLYQHGTYGPLVEPVNPNLSGDAGRTELVRVELDRDDKEIADTLELVAEYAVDLKFGLTASVATPNTVITRSAIGAAAVYTTAATPAAGGTPQRIRNVQVRLSTRARAPDRSSNIPAGNDGRLTRFQVPGLASTERFFRVRTLQTEVALPNLLGVTW